MEMTINDERDRRDRAPAIIDRILETSSAPAGRIEIREDRLLLYRLSRSRTRLGIPRNTEYIRATCVLVGVASAFVTSVL